MITTVTSFKGYTDKSKILHNEKQEEEINYSKKGKSKEIS